MPDETPTPRRRVRLVPVSGPGSRPDAVPVAKQTLAKAHNRIGPDGLGDIESRLAASKEVEDEIERGGASASRGNPDKTYPVRLCEQNCSFRVGGGPGCTVYQRFLGDGVNLDGDQCERDLIVLREMEETFGEGKEDKIRELAGRFTGAIVLQMQNLLTRIIADGACVEVPIFDAKGGPVHTEEFVYDVNGTQLFKDDGEPRIIKTLMTRKVEHPLFPRLTQLLKETRLIDLAQYELTPKSSQVPAQTDGMILAEDGGPKTMEEIKGDIGVQLRKMDDILIIAARKRAEDPTFQRMSGKYDESGALKED